MIGSTIFTVRRVPGWCWFTLVISLIFVVLGLAISTFFLFAVGVVLLSVCLAGMIFAESRVVAEFHEQGITVYPDGISIDYVSLEAVAGVAATKRKKDRDFYAIDIATNDFGFRIPANTNFPASALEQFLVEQLNPFIDLPPDENIATFYTEQTAKYGADNVHIFHGRVRPRRTTSAWQVWRLTLFPVVACLLLIPVGNVIPFRARQISADIFAFEIIAFIIIFCWFLIAMISRKSVYKLPKVVPKKTNLVVSPDGFALSQGPLKGKIGWNQILGFDFKYASGMTLSSQQNALGVLNVKIDGSVITILDAYDRSLSFIEEVMRNNAFRQPHPLR